LQGLRQSLVSHAPAGLFTRSPEARTEQSHEARRIAANIAKRPERLGTD
jgi:hypothetical protein